MAGWGGDSPKTQLDPGATAFEPTVKADMQSVEVTSDQKSNTAAQDHGWAAPFQTNYARYMQSSEERRQGPLPADLVGDDDEQDEGVGGRSLGQWISEAEVYEWKEEFGDVGPAHPVLEEQLFGCKNHVKTGINFQELTSIEVVQEGAVQVTKIDKFEDAGLHPVMLRNVELAGYVLPTPIQQYVLPAVKQGHDLVACAQTGSGKTAAYLIPMLSKLMGKAKKLCAPRPNPAQFQDGSRTQVRAEPLILIVCPTRELAGQIFDEARRFCYRTMMRPCVVYGGGPVGMQIESLQKGCDLLIGTPGRLVDVMQRVHVLSLKRLKYMVIDEADEMLQSDWENELKMIMSGGDQEEGNINYMLFSATFPKACRDLAKEHLAHNHVRFRVGRAGSSHRNIKQDVIYVNPENKFSALADLLMAAPQARTIIFVNSRRAADLVDDFLHNQHKVPCTTIHGERTQLEREDSIRAFRRGRQPVLITTALASRGLDIANVMHVINYDMPSAQYGGIEEYTHRIGRTGRIGNRGLATSFYNDRDADIAEALVKTLIETGQDVPDFLQHLLPEGFTTSAEGTIEGDLANLRFDADSDHGDNNKTEGGDASGGAAGGDWGTGGVAGDNAAAGASAEGGWGSGGGDAATAMDTNGGDAWGIGETGGAIPGGGW